MTPGALLLALFDDAAPIKQFGVCFDSNIDTDGKSWEATE
jgi:hypothetical protein